MEYADVQLSVKKLPTSGIDTYSINTNETKYNALNLYTTYNLELGKHKASVMAGFNQENSWYGEFNASIDQQSVPTVPSFGGGTGTKNISESYSEYAIRGAFGRLTYSYDDKYLLTANMRYDGSSKFLPFSFNRLALGTGKVHGLESQLSGRFQAPCILRFYR